MRLRLKTLNIRRRADSSLIPKTSPSLENFAILSPSPESENSSSESESVHHRLLLTDLNSDLNHR